jgi:transposase
MMFGLGDSLDVLLFLAPTDMRKAFDTLAGEVKKMGQNPLSGNIYVFIGKRGNRVKILWWYRGGYFLLSRRLEEGTFTIPVPGAGEEIALKIDMTELGLLLEGIELGRIRRKKNFVPKNVDNANSMYDYVNA